MMKRLFGGALVLAAIVCACASVVRAGDAYQDFDNEDIKPYIKIMKGPWVNSIVTGVKGDYRLNAKIPRDSEWVLGLFDHKINRAGKDQRSAVVLVDGVNPLNPAERIATHEIGQTDVSWMRKVPMDGLTFNSRDAAGRDCCVKVVDSKEEYEFGPVKAFAVPKGRSGVLGRVDIFVYEGAAVPPNPGDVIHYGAPIRKFAITLAQE